MASTDSSQLYYYNMPYSGPTSPAISPAKETAPHSKKGFFNAPPTHVENVDSSTGISGPMPGLPRRASSRPTSPAMSRAGSSSGSTINGNYQPFTVTRPDDGLPRRSCHTPTGSTSGLPQHVGSLGLKLHPSPTRAQASSSRTQNHSLDSTSTTDSSLPVTPRDDNVDLAPESELKADEAPVSFPPFEPAPRSLASNRPRPSKLFRQMSGPITSGQQGPRHTRGMGSLQLSIPGSASTSQLASSPSDSPVEARPTRPAFMIRKKSGEVVKPSLKQRSMSTPDLTRLPEESPDYADADRNFGEERSKSVRFADDDETPGSTLANVVLFLHNSRPVAVSKAADPDNHLTETETEADTDASDYVHFRTRRNAATRAEDDARDIALEGGSRVPRVRCDFSPDARHALNGENVVMERADLRTINGALCLQGTVIVRNVAFQKWVAIRFTMDHWQTVSEVSGSHVTHIPSSTTGDEGWDRFSFSIKLEDYRRKLDERQLLICIRFSVEGQEWWDSNNGLNYQFNFKRSSPRRTRHSLPPSYNNKIGADYATANSLPGLRQNSRGSFAPSSRIAQQLGSGRPTSASAQNWTFPTLGMGSTPRRSGSRSPSRSGADSPMLSPPPAMAYRPPGPPDVHNHLTLSRYCAPSPPQSPNKEDTASLAGPSTTRSPEEMTAAQRQTSSDIIGTSSSTLEVPAHERRSSWAGKVGSWDSFSQVLTEGSENGASTDGGSTPVAGGSQTPSKNEESSPASPPHKPLSMKRSTGDLQALRAGVAGLMTPPSSHSSSPSPLRSTVPLPNEAAGVPPMSPYPSSNSTGESSPINTVANASIADLVNMEVRIEPSEGAHRLLDDSTYQAFLSKFCFFTSPRSTPMADDLPPVRNNYVHVSGHASPVGFPFHSTGPTAGYSSQPSYDTTPRREYDSAQDAFNFRPQGQSSGRDSPSTPRPGSRVGQNDKPTNGHDDGNSDADDNEDDNDEDNAKDSAGKPNKSTTWASRRVRPTSTVPSAR